MGFVFVVGVVLFLAQFTPALELRMLRRQVKKYEKVPQENEDEDVEMEEFNGFTKDREARMPDGGSGVKRRRPSHLTVNTATKYHGLGIAVPGEQCVEGASADDSSSSPQIERTTPSRNVFATALMPSKSRFSPYHRSPLSKPPLSAFQPNEYTSTNNSLATPRLLRAPSTDIFDIDSPLHHSLQTQGDKHSSGLSENAFFRKVNNGVTYAAEKFSKKLHDHITGPEEGLLLPIREEERASPLVYGESVD